MLTTPTVPAQTKPMQKKNVKRIQLLCVAHPSDVDGWEAFCLDFDLAVQAQTFDDAKAALQDMIVSYVKDATQEAEPARSQLLNRRAPLRVRLAWGWRFFIDAIRDRRDRDDNVAVGFPVTYPA